MGQGRISPSYGVVVPAIKLLWRRSGPTPATLTMSVSPRPVVSLRSPSEGLQEWHFQIPVGSRS